MKTLSNILLCFVGTFLLYNCSDSNVPDSFVPSLSGHSLNISKSQLSFDAQGGVENATINSNNTSWQITGIPKWISVNPQQGKSTSTVTFTASENTSADTARTAIFYLESADASWSYKTTLSATQQAATSFITPSASSLTFGGSKGLQVVNVASNVEWYSTSSASWLHAETSADGKSVVITVDENQSDSSRSGIITLGSGHGITASITIVQEPAGVTGSTETLEFGKDGGSKTVSITAESKWESKTSDTWITVSPSSGEAGTHSINITVDANNSVSVRTGYVYVNVGNSSKLQIPISQKGLYLEVKPSSLSFSADTESKQLEISSNTDWYVTSLPDWLTASPKSGKNNQMITLKSQLNTSSSSRSGKIMIEKQGLSLSAIVDVLQEGLNLSVDNNNLQFGSETSTQNVIINTYVGWTASSSDGWITLSQTSGTGKSTLSIYVEENREDSPRTGFVRVIAGELSQTITITQQGKYFNITETDKTFTSRGGALQISFSTNDSWTAMVSDNASWLTLSSKSGSGDAVINITAADNASMKSRETTIVIKPGNGQGVKVGVKQAGRYLIVDTESLSFNHSGGISAPVTVSSDGSYDISVTDSWMSIREVSSSSFCVEVPENEGKSRRGKVRIEMKGLANGESYETYIFIEQEGNDIDGHEYVDLGLPSGTKWATSNIGANNPSDKGSLFAWGEATPRTHFTSDEYVYSKPFSDAAEVLWGRKWQIPTKEQMDELVSLCEWKPVYSGVKFVGVYVYGPNGKSLYLPECSNDPYDTWSRYWSNTLYTNSNQAYHLRIDGGNKSVISLYRYFGAAIRPVVRK